MEETVRPEVYLPAEDTRLLLRAALNEVRSSDSVLEIGCGMGEISRCLAGRAGKVLATDLNRHAVMLAKASGLEAVRADLFRGIGARFDLVLFNPPYLPTSEEERLEGWINYALDGGPSGRETISRFLEDLRDHLSPTGRALLLVSSLCGLDEVVRKAEDEGLEVEEVAKERYFFEELQILRLTAR